MVFRSTSMCIHYAGLAALGAAVLLAGVPVVATTARATITLHGAGSTFVAPVMIGQWIPGYISAHPTVRISYDAVGSTTGIGLWTAGKALFAGSDAALKSVQEKAARTHCGSDVVKIPATISAVALIYNVPGVKTGLQFSPAVVANIFLGHVTAWNDPSIRKLNPGVALPHLTIQTVHRSGGSGTTYIITNYLSAASAAWKRGPGAGTTVTWPVGAAVKGSAGVVEAVSTTLGAIGYVDLAFAVQDNLDYARVQNAHGSFIRPGVDAASAAADSFAPSMPADLQQIIVNSRAAAAYPITGYSYIFMCGRQAGASGQALIDFVRYAVTAGQTGVKRLFYAPLPPSVQRLTIAALSKITTR